MIREALPAYSERFKMAAAVRYRFPGMLLYGYRQSYEHTGDQQQYLAVAGCCQTYPAK